MNKPTKRFVCGGVEAGIWENEQTAGDRTFTTRSVSLSRRYRNSNGEWGWSTSFRKNDLPKVAVVCDEAYRYLNTKEADEEHEGSTPAESD